MYSEIVNPKTGRKCSIYSNLGKNILKNYMEIIQNGGSKWSDYDKGVRKLTIILIKEAMVKLGLTNSRGQAAVDVLKDYVGKNTNDAVKKGFTKTWSKYLGSKAGCEELVEELKLRSVKVSIISTHGTGNKTTEELLKLTGTPVVKDDDKLEEAREKEKKGGPEILYIEDIEEAQGLVEAVVEEIIDTQEDGVVNAKEATTNVLAVINLMNNDPDLTPGEIIEAAPGLEETVNIVEEIVAEEPTIVDDISPLVKVSTGNVVVTSRYYCVKPYKKNGAKKKDRITACKKKKSKEQQNMDDSEVPSYDSRQMCIEECSL